MPMELQLGLALIPTKPLNINAPSFHFNSPTHKKRPIDANPSSAFRRTLPLLLWNDHPNNDHHHDDDDPNHPHSASDSDDEEEEQENGIVGWPPLKKRRKRLFTEKRGGRRRRRRVAVIRRPAVENGGGFYRELNYSNSRYVKVKMEGVGIARKVDLSQYHCFAVLRATLMNMFDVTDSDAYRLTYQDINGDWLLAQDVTWRNFIGTVQRIKLEKNNG